MSKMIVIVFETERQAYEGTRALKELHDEGSISLYGQAVVVKDSSGKAVVKDAADKGPLGTAVGLLTGSLIGVLGGPVGLAVGAATGTYAGALYDLLAAGIDMDFVGEASAQIEPGKAAVVAEIEEEWVTPLDTRMEDLGGRVSRRTRGQVEDALIAQDMAAIDADIASLETEYEQASGEAKAKLRAKIDAARARLQQVQARAKASAEAARRESDAKVAALKEQAGNARAEQKQQLDKRMAEVQEAHKRRMAKLQQASELR